METNGHHQLGKVFMIDPRVFGCVVRVCIDSGQAMGKRVQAVTHMAPQVGIGVVVRYR